MKKFSKILSKVLQVILVIIITLALTAIPKRVLAAQIIMYPATDLCSGWPTSWLALPGLNDPHDVGVKEQIDFVGDSINPGVYVGGTSTYLYFRVRVDADVSTAADFRDSVFIIIDKDNNGTPDYAFSWDSKSDDITKHGLEMNKIAVDGVTWASTSFDDVDNLVAQKTSPPDFNLLGDGCVRTNDGQATTNFSNTTFIDFAISWDYLINKSGTGLGKGQTWGIQIGSIANATDHNNITADVAGGQSPTGSGAFPTTITISSGGTPTPVTISYFKAEAQGDHVNINWSTSTETGNVGFNLYAETDGGNLLQINEDLIPSNVVNSLKRQDYSFNADMVGNSFYIEDVDIRGGVHRYGPFQIGEEYGLKIDGEKIDLAAIKAEHNRNFDNQQDELKKNLQVPAMALQAARGTEEALQLTNSLNLKVSRTGIYRVSYEMLKAAGLDLAGVPDNKITLTNRGQMVPIFVEGEGEFDPGAFLEFYGESLDTLYTDESIYTLQISQSPADRIQVDNAVPDEGLVPPASFTETLQVNNQRTYANYAPGDDPWFDTMMWVKTQALSWDTPFQINGLSDPSMPASLSLVVWGGSSGPQDPDHHIQVSLNGIRIGEDTFDGMIVEHRMTMSVPAGVLREGENILQLTLPGDTGLKNEMIILDTFSLTYQRVFQAEDGWLSFNADGEFFNVTNLPAGDVIVYRMDENGIVRFGQVETQKIGSTFTASFAGSNQPATYLVTTVSALYTPSLEASRLVPEIDQAAQYLIISHPDFISGLQPLVDARRVQGYSVNVVDVNDLYTRYTYGIFDPQAIKEYIAYAAGNLGTQYVLLVGGDTYDYRNYLGINSFSFIPSLYTKTGALITYTPVDQLFGDVNGDNVPELGVGRFPVRNLAELDLLVTKTLAYANKSYNGTAFFASDKFDGIVSFKEISTILSASVPASWSVESAHLDDLGPAVAKQNLLDAMNRGTALVTFTGHSGPLQWTYSNLFNTTDAKSLTNTGRPFVVVQWGCWNNYFVDPAYNNLVQSFLFSGNQGAVLTLGAVNLTDSVSEQLLGELLIPRLVTPGMTVGQAMVDAKQELAQTHPELLDVLLGWSLMGDPTLIMGAFEYDLLYSQFLPLLIK